MASSPRSALHASTASSALMSGGAASPTSTASPAYNVCFESTVTIKPDPDGEVDYVFEIESEHRFLKHTLSQFVSWKDVISGCLEPMLDDESKVQSAQRFLENTLQNSIMFALTDFMSWMPQERHRADFLRTVLDIPKHGQIDMKFKGRTISLGITVNDSVFQSAIRMCASLHMWEGHRQYPDITLQ